MSNAKQGAGSIYFATLQGYVINETNLYTYTMVKSMKPLRLLDCVIPPGPYQKFWGSGENGQLFSGIGGKRTFIFRGLGRMQKIGNFRKQGTRNLWINILGISGERPFYYQGAGSEDLVGPHHSY